MFRKPKKIQRRVFTSTTLDDEDEQSRNVSENLDNRQLDIDGEDFMPAAPPAPVISKKEKSSSVGSGGGKESKKSSKSETGSNVKGKSLLSFADEDDDAEVFQVRKSSHSKKMMRMMDKERRKKRKEERDGGIYTASSAVAATTSTTCDRQYNERNDRNGNVNSSYSNNNNSNNSSFNVGSAPSSTLNCKYKSSSSSAAACGGAIVEQCKSKKSIQTEIRTDDFVLVVKKSEPDIVLNGRAALCAGRNDMSDEDDDGDGREEGDDDDADGGGDGRLRRHRFSKPETLKQMLENGSIPDAAMIHAARKRRQRAREQGDFIPVEEPKEAPKKGSRLTREDLEDDDNSDGEARVDMSDITGMKEREERREQFYAVQNDFMEDSDHETNDWENQQIRKGVTGAQLVSVQSDAALTRFMIKSSSSASSTTRTNSVVDTDDATSTSTLLQQAYAKNSLDKPLQQSQAQSQLMASKKGAKKEKTKNAAMRTPSEITAAIRERLTKLKEVNHRHTDDVARISNELKVLQLEEMECNQKAPTAAAKYRFYQEVKCYVADLVDCLNEKMPLLYDLEKRSLQLFAKHQSYLIERRRQDVRDQAKEMAEASKPVTVRRNGTDYEEQVRRAAEREGRRTRRRCERERNGQLAAHLDGMSSDDETADQYQEQFQNNIEQIDKEAEVIFNDVNDEFYKIDLILMKFFAWRKTDINAYNDAFVHICLPKILGPLIRCEILTWSPLLEEYKDIEKMNWYSVAMLYAWDEDETEESLKSDPDVNLVPTIIEKIFLPKVTEIVNQCWDPLSTTQTLRLIGFINRIGRDYPLKATSKSLQRLFDAILEKMQLALEHDVFIPIFPKQVHEAKTSFFQRQFCSGLKLFRNFLSWQGVLADKPLRELAIDALLNRYLLLAMRVCTANDAISKAYIVVNTLPTVWLQPDSETHKNMELFIAYIKQKLEDCDVKNPLFVQTCEKAKLILQRMHSL